MVNTDRTFKKKISYFIASIFYKLSIDILYVLGTSIVYSYLGRGLSFNVQKYIVGWVAFVLLLLLIEKIRIEKIRFMIKCIFMFSGTSNMSVYGLRNYEVNYFFIVVLFWILIISTCVFLPHVKQFNAFNRKRFTKEIIFNNKDELLLFFGLLITVLAVAKFGLSVSSFAGIYFARESFRSQSLSTIDSYLLSWNGTVILPWCFLVSLKRKKYGQSVIALLLGIIMFLINGLKTWLVIYVIVVVFSILLGKKKDYDFSLNVVMAGFGGMILSSVVYFVKTAHYGLVGLLDRTAVLPGEVNYFYLDFFSKNELLYLRESIFKYFAASPYSPWSAVQISQNYMSAAYYHNATNGLVGDIYGNFGIIGIVVYPIIIVITFVILNHMLDGYDEIISAVVILILMWLLVNTSFFTWLMTGGYFIYLFILYFYKKYRVKII